MRFRILAAILLVIVSTPSATLAEQKPKTDVMLEFNRKHYEDLLKIKNLYFIMVRLDGTAEKLLNEDELSDFLKMRVKNSFAGYAMRDLPRDSSGNTAIADIKDEEWGYISVNVWSVGEGVTTAYHIEFTLTKFLGSKNPLEIPVLGLCSTDKFKDGRIVKEVITDLVDDAAVRLMKMKGEI